MSVRSAVVLVVSECCGSWGCVAVLFDFGVCACLVIFGGQPVLLDIRGSASLAGYSGVSQSCRMLKCQPVLPDVGGQPIRDHVGVLRLFVGSGGVAPVVRGGEARQCVGCCMGYHYACRRECSEQYIVVWVAT